MDKSKLGKAIEIQKELRRKLKTIIGFAIDKQRIIDSVELGKAEDSLNFTIKELTKIKSGEYITEEYFHIMLEKQKKGFKDSLLSVEDIADILYKYRTDYQLNDKISSADIDLHIAEALSSKIARLVDRKKIEREITKILCLYNKRTPDCRFCSARQTSCTETASAITEKIMAEIGG